MCRAIVWRIQGKCCITVRFRRLRDWDRHTFSIALLVRAPLYALLPLLAMRVDTLLRDAVLDTPEARSRVVALLTGLLTIGACVLNLSALATGWWSRYDARREGIHMHRHAGVRQGMHGHRRLQIGGLSLMRWWFARFWGWIVWHLCQSG